MENKHLPYFEFEDFTFEGVLQNKVISFGDGEFVPHGRISQNAELVFRVKRDIAWNCQKLRVKFEADILRSAIFRHVDEPVAASIARGEYVNIFEVLAYWDRLKSIFAAIELGNFSASEVRMLDLFLKDFALDERVYHDTRLERHYRTGKLPVSHRNAMRAWGAQKDLAHIDDVILPLLCTQRSLYQDSLECGVMEIPPLWDTPYPLLSFEAVRRLLTADGGTDRKQFMALKLGEEVRGIYNKLSSLAESSRASQGLRDLVRSLNGPWGLYKLGSSTIRKLLAGKCPQDVRQVLSCVIVGKCMQVVCASEQITHTMFVKDLATWCSLLEDMELPLFNLVTFHLWSYIPHPDDLRAFSTPLDRTVQLELALDLATLISTMAQNVSSPNSLFDFYLWETQEDQTRKGRNGEAGYPPFSILPSHMTLCNGPPDSALDDFQNRHKQRQEEVESCEFLPDAHLVWLAAGAIFAAIVCFLLMWRFGYSAMALGTHLLATLDSPSDAIKEAQRNSLHIFLYMTLFLHGVESDGERTMSDTGSEAPADDSQASVMEFEIDQKNILNLNVETSTHQELTAGILLHDSKWWMNNSSQIYGEHDHKSNGVASGNDLSISPSGSLITTASTQDYHTSSETASTRMLSQENRFPCGLCRKAFRTNSSRNKHEKGVCPKLGQARPKFPCKDCGKKLSQAHYLETGHAQRCKGRKALTEMSS